MITVKAFAAMVWMAICAAGFEHQSGSPCGFTLLDLDGPINRMLQQLPESQLPWPPAPNARFLGVEFSNLNITGLNKLKRYGAIVPFCVNGTRFIEVDFVQLGDVAITVPWKICAGREGYIQLRSRLSRFTTIFCVQSTELGQVVSLVYEGPALPVTTEELRVIVYGAGFAANLVMEYLSFAFPAVLREIWNEEFFTFFLLSVKKVLS